MPLRPLPTDVLEGLASASAGLSAADAVVRRTRYGANDILVAPPSTWMDLVRDTLRDPMIWFLVGVSALFALLGNTMEALVLVAALVPLAGMDAWLHRRTQASTQGLVSRLASSARVFRDGAVQVVPARDLVPGDLVEMSSGDPFPADGIFVEGDGLQADESALTGESWPVRKSPVVPRSEAPKALDVGHWAFAGTRLLTGRARLRVLATGGETLYAEIVRSALSSAHEPTPLQKSVGQLVSVMLGAALLLCLLLGGVRLVQGHGLVDAFLSAVTLAVAALPEEFPVVLSIFLGVGVYRLARRQALVRRAVAVENIGRVTCICSDKTGTLTEGRLVLAHRVTIGDVSAGMLLSWAAMAARADSGDPLDDAILALSGIRTEQRLATFPFTEDRRRETAILREQSGAIVAVMKGAPETLLGFCRESAESANAWRARVLQLAAGGHKVLAVARRVLAGELSLLQEPGDGYELCGLLAFEDPVREGVREAVRQCEEGGIRVIMVTGDHPATAEAVGREVGLGGGAPCVVLAEALETGGQAPDTELLKTVDVIARAAPSQKLRLVEALRRSGEIVAVTGDGVNDVPALKAADVGIAMGERGTQSAREVASIVLLDDNFRTIVAAVAEGRQLFFNLRLAFVYLLMVHVPLVVSAAVIPLADNPIVFLPIHIVWLELIIHPTALLVFQDVVSATRLAPVRSGSASGFFSLRVWVLILGSGLVLAVLVFVAFMQGLGSGGDVAAARSLAIGVLVSASAGITVGLSRFSSPPALWVPALSLLSLVLFLQIPGLAVLLELTPLSPGSWGLVALSCGAALLLATLVRTGMYSGDKDFD